MKSFTGALAALFSLHMEAEEPEAAVPKEPPAIHGRPPLEISMAYNENREPVRRPLLLAPPYRNPLEEMRRDPKFPKPYDVVIYNRRVRSDYVAGMLERVFHQSVDYAGACADHADKIYMGAYTFEVAQTKAKQARKDAKAHGYPGLHVRCRLSPKGS